MQLMAVDTDGRYEAGWAALIVIAATRSPYRGVKTVPHLYGLTPVGGSAVQMANGRQQLIKIANEVGDEDHLNVFVGDGAASAKISTRMTRRRHRRFWIL